MTIFIWRLNLRMMQWQYFKTRFYQRRCSGYYRNRWRCQFLTLLILICWWIFQIMKAWTLIKQAYLDIDKKALEFVPRMACMLFHMWQCSRSSVQQSNVWGIWLGNSGNLGWIYSPFCEQIQSEGIQPLYFGFKDTWTCLAPVECDVADLAPADVCSQVNKGETTFSDEYREVAEKTQATACLWAKKIHLPMITMELVQHLQTENLQCTRSEVMQSHRFRQ